VHWTQLAQDGNEWQALFKTIEVFWSIKPDVFFSGWATNSFSKSTILHGAVKFPISCVRIAFPIQHLILL
jgi:hypothetical protein